MNPIETDLQALEELYAWLEAQLETQRRDCDEGRPACLEWEGSSEKLRERIAALEKRIVDSLRDYLGPSRDDSARRSGIRTRVASLHARAGRLLELMEGNSSRFRSVQNEVRASLQTVNSGGRFLQSVRGAREAQPKFIDARQ
jgi:chromosome segregation ATPase